MDTHSFVIAGLVVIAILCVGFAVQPYLSGDIRAENRTAALAKGGMKQIVNRAKDNDARRKQVADSLKEIDQRHVKKVTLEARFMQAGLNWTRTKFYVISTVMALGLVVVMSLLNRNLFVLGATAVVGFFGLPRWLLTFLKKRRLKKFIEGFAGSIDIIVRGIKAGLPLGDCLRIIATEAPEPVRSEFRRIIEGTSIGLSASESIDRLVDRVPIPEASFFAIVISIQQKAGGNLAEALSNLSRVLRERKKMKQKIVAMASEAKASAGIIGSLPIIVPILIYITSPKYIMLLFTTNLGHIVVGISLAWMGIGILVMKKMINFDF